jgi:hypothetical protein
MVANVGISTELKQAVDKYLENDPNAKTIAEAEQKVIDMRNALIDQESELEALKKKRPEVTIKYRDSINWCLEIDADNPFYFLKSKEGLVKCVEYKNKTKLTPSQNNSFGGILSTMFKEGLIGRIMYTDVYFYGLKSMFEKDEKGFLTKLKKKYEKNVPDLKQVNVKF